MQKVFKSCPKADPAETVTTGTGLKVLGHASLLRTILFSRSLATKGELDYCESCVREGGIIARSVLIYFAKRFVNNPAAVAELNAMWLEVTRQEASLGKAVNQ